MCRTILSMSLFFALVLMFTACYTVSAPSDSPSATGLPTEKAVRAIRTQQECLKLLGEPDERSTFSGVGNVIESECWLYRQAARIGDRAYDVRVVWSLQRTKDKPAITLQDAENGEFVR